MLQTRPRASPSPDARSPESRRLRHDLRQSLRDGAFTLSFQTRRSLRDQARLGAEAQVKWPCRGRGVLQPSAFMPMLDECGLAHELLAWTLTAACRAGCTWPHGTVSVSVPAASAQDGTLLPLTGQALVDTGLDPERLELAFQDADLAGDCPDTLLALSALRDLGVGVALEAFGRTGACLVKLKHLPLTAIKLDRALVRDQPTDAAMLSSLIGFAHALDIEVVAPVETSAQRDVLARLGCNASIEREKDLGGTCRPPQTPRHQFDGGSGGDGTSPPAFFSTLP